MDTEPLPDWLQKIIFLIIFIAIVFASIGNFLIADDLEKAREKDPWIIIIE